MKCLFGVLAILCLAAVAAASDIKLGEPVDSLRCIAEPLTNQITLGVPFGVEMTLENTSDKPLATRFVNGIMYSSQRIGGEWHETRFGPSDQTIVLDRDGIPKPPVNEIVLLPAGASYRTIVWILWGDIEGLPRNIYRYAPPPLGQVRMFYRHQTPDGFWKDRGAGLSAKLWTGYTYSQEMVLDVVRDEPAKAVAATLAIARKQMFAGNRSVAREALSMMTCRYFGEGPGMTDEDLAQAEKWFEANGQKGRGAWITAALSNQDYAERRLAADLAILVKDPAQADGLIAALNPAEPNIAAKVLETLFAHYQDPRASDYARKVFRDGPWSSQADVVNLAFKYKVQPIMKEGGEALAGWIKTEKDPKTLDGMVTVAGTLKIPETLPVLEELDRRQPTPVPWRLLAAIWEFRGKDYEPRVIEHLLQNNDPEARSGAIWVLNAYGTPQCIDALIAALDDKDLNVRTGACRAMQKKGRNCSPVQRIKAMEALIKLLDTDEKIESIYIRDALGSLNILGYPPTEYDRHKSAEAWRAVLQKHREREK
jgi:hypothetical protein